MGCFVRDDKNGMGCFVRGDKSCMGCFVRGGKLTYVPPGLTGKYDF